VIKKAPPLDTLPTAGRWSALARFQLAGASRRTRSQAARADAISAPDAVLAWIVAQAMPVTISPGAVAEAVGVSVDTVYTALSDLEASGRIEPGSTDSRRIGLTCTPAVLDALGLGKFAIDTATIPTPKGGGAIIGLSDAAMRRAMEVAA
jgi:hypothetical protein